MKQITRIRKAVCAMANELKKSGYSLSESFRKSWKSSLIQIIGGYSYKEMLGALINIAV